MFEEAVMTGCMALVSQVFLDKTGSKLTREQCKKFIKDHTNSSGCFILPNPEDIDYECYTS